MRPCTSRVIGALLLGCVLCAAPSTAGASGEAAATVRSRWFVVRLSTGVRKIVGREKHDPNDRCPHVGYFEREERELLRHLGPAIPAISKLVSGARGRLSLVPIEPALPGPLELPRAEDFPAAEARKWFAGGKARVALVRGRSRGEHGPVVTLELAVTRPVDARQLDQLAGEVKRAIARTPLAHEAATPTSPDGCQAAPAVPRQVVLAEARTVYRPGLRVRIGKAASAIDAAHTAWWQSQLDAYAQRVQDAFVAELRGHATELGLPADWPASPARGAPALAGADPPAAARNLALYVSFNGLDPNVGFLVPLASEPPDKLSEALFKKLYDRIAPPSVP